jgi:hypothetical protein
MAAPSRSLARGADADTDKIVDDGRRACAFGAARAHMIDQHRGREHQGVRLADGVTLEELQMGLLASLPLGDRLEGLDVPPDQFRERRCTVLDGHFAGQAPWPGRSHTASA